MSNPFLLKARKNFDIPTECIYLLNSEKYKKFSPKTIKLLLSQHAKKKPFSKMSLGSKIPLSTTIIGRNVKNFFYFNEKSNLKSQKLQRKFLRLIGSTYKHLEYLDVRKLDIQNKSSLGSISKLNHLQSLIMDLFLGKPIPPPRFFQNLKHLRHISLSITELIQNKETDIASITGFLYNLTLLPSLESYNMAIYTAVSEKSESFVGTVFYYLDLLKAKRFSVKLLCSEEIDLKLEMFSSFLQSVDTLEYKYFGSTPSLPCHFQAPTSKELILFLKPSEKKQSLPSLINACPSLENLYFEQRKITVNLNLPQTLKNLVLSISSPQLPKTCKFWEGMLSSLTNLEDLSFTIKNPDVIIQDWISQLPKRASLKSLKKYDLKLEGDTTLAPGAKLEYDSFLTQWSRGIQSLKNLESLSLKITFVLLKSLDFFTEAIASSPKLRNIKLNLLLHHSQPKETLKLCLPSQKNSSLEHIWLDVSQYLSKDSAEKILQEISHCENLQSFNVSGLAFDEETAIATFKGLAQLRELEIETNTKGFLTINSKKEIIKHKSRFFKRRMAN